MNVIQTSNEYNQTIHESLQIAYECDSRQQIYVNLTLAVNKIYLEEGYWHMFGRIWISARGLLVRFFLQ